MILVINHLESATLTLNLSRMRKSYRNLVKARYKARRDELYTSYDYVLDNVKNALESQLEVNELHLNKVDLEVLESFLKGYIGELDELKLKHEEDIQQIKIMKELHLRCERLLTA